jgi:hypothetical protein
MDVSGAGSKGVTWAQLIPTLAGLTITLVTGCLAAYGRLQLVEWRVDQHLKSGTMHSGTEARMQNMEKALQALHVQESRTEEKLAALQAILDDLRGKHRGSRP